MKLILFKLITLWSAAPTLLIVGRCDLIHKIYTSKSIEEIIKFIDTPIN